jgi:phosphate transport system substrate-binding protein
MNPLPHCCVRSLRAFLASFGLALVIFGFAGCSDERPPASAPLSGQISIKGSNTFGEELAPRLIAEYRRERPNVTVTLESKGSGSGIAALLAGECDIGATSRNITPEEQSEARGQGIEFKEYVIGYYGVAVIVNRSNLTERLTKEQVKAIFTGSMRNWREVGGPDVPIHLAIRDPISGTNLGFRELAMDNLPYAEEARAFTTYPDLARAVAADPGGIGYSSMNMAKANGIKAVAIGAYAPTTVSVNENWYPYARMLRLVTNKTHEATAARDFVLFVQRERGQAIIDELGFVRRFEKRLNSLTPDN